MRTIFFLFLCLLTAGALAQPKAKMNKAVEKFREGEMEEAISDMRKLLKKEASEEGWSILVDMYYQRWRDAVDPSARMGKWMGLATFGQGPKTFIARDKVECHRDLLDASIEATLFARSTTASFTLRSAVVDHAVDTARTEEAREAFELAESAFTDKEYTKAMEYYREVLRIMPADYQATIYLGDCHFFLEAYDSAAFYFSRGVAMQPTLLEPRKYLVDALGHAGDNEGALRETMHTFRIYPDESIFLKLGDLHERMGRRFDRHWIPRPGPVNLMGVDQSALDGPWKEYRAAKEELAPYCDENGIVVKPGAPDGARFLEVFSWQRMLQRAKGLPKEFDFATHLNERGELDLYVFLCVFHHGFYEQYKAFVSTDADRFDAFLKERLAE
jgi:tetratricopeptide (TPR) repeat protein